MTTNTDSDRLAEIQERAEKSAVKGSWQIIRRYPHRDTLYLLEQLEGEKQHVLELKKEYYKANQALIARLLTVKEQLATAQKLNEDMLPAAKRGIVNSQRKDNWREAAQAALRELEGK